MKFVYCNREMIMYIVKSWSITASVYFEVFIKL